MDVLIERCAGLDVRKKTVVACIRTPDDSPSRHATPPRCDQRSKVSTNSG